MRRPGPTCAQPLAARRRRRRRPSDLQASACAKCARNALRDGGHGGHDGPRRGRFGQSAASGPARRAPRAHSLASVASSLSPPPPSGQPFVAAPRFWKPCGAPEEGVGSGTTSRGAVRGRRRRGDAHPALRFQARSHCCDQTNHNPMETLQHPLPSSCSFLAHLPRPVRLSVAALGGFAQRRCWPPTAIG